MQLDCNARPPQPGAPSHLDCSVLGVGTLVRRPGCPWARAAAMWPEQLDSGRFVTETLLVKGRIPLVTAGGTEVHRPAKALVQPEASQAPVCGEGWTSAFPTPKCPPRAQLRKPASCHHLTSPHIPHPLGPHRLEHPPRWGDGAGGPGPAPCSPPPTVLPSADPSPEARLIRGSTTSCGQPRREQHMPAAAISSLSLARAPSPRSTSCSPRGACLQEAVGVEVRMALREPTPQLTTGP